MMQTPTISDQDQHLRALDARRTSARAEASTAASKVADARVRLARLDVFGAKSGTDERAQLEKELALYEAEEMAALAQENAAVAERDAITAAKKAAEREQFEAEERAKAAERESMRKRMEEHLEMCRSIAGEQGTIVREGSKALAALADAYIRAADVAARYTEAHANARMLAIALGESIEHEALSLQTIGVKVHANARLDDRCAAFNAKAEGTGQSMHAFELERSIARWAFELGRLGRL